MEETTIHKCRTCLKNTTRTFPLSKPAIGCRPKISYAHLLKEFAKLEFNLEREHNLPQYLCSLCCRQLRNTYAFVRQAQYCNSKLIKVLTKQLDCLREQTIDFPSIELDKSVNIKLEKDGDLDDGNPRESMTDAINIKNEKNATSIKFLKDELLENIPDYPFRERNDAEDEKKNNKTQSLDISVECSSISDNNISTKNFNSTSTTESSETYDPKVACPICNKLISRRDNLIKHMRVQHSIKDPLNIEGNFNSKTEEPQKDIKEEKEENGVVDININYDESQEERDFLEDSNSDSSDDDNDDIKSEDDISASHSNEAIARCCDICHKVYGSEKFLRIHKRYSHMSEEDKLPCPMCTYKASRSSALKVHMGLVHGPEKASEYFKPVLDSSKKYPCSLCQRSYGRKYNLQKHFRRKHRNNSTKEESHKKEKPRKQKEKERFLCTYCGQSYSTKRGLKSHIITHTGERPYSCDICSKTFKRLNSLQYHRVIHSDEKPHQCSECDKAFKRVDKLKIHMRVHSELRAYKCNECEKTFKYPSVLKTHMHIHTGQTPFACKTCGEAFSLRTSLNTHCLKNSHIK